MYHVTRQSFGVCKLYCKDSNENKFQEISIYVTSFIFFLIGYLRFYIPIIKEEDIILLNIIVGVLFTSLCIYYLIKYKYSENFLVFLTGCLIFYPICFVSSPVHAIIMGVTMHYTQYLYLTYNICNLRQKRELEIEKKTSFQSIIKIFIYNNLLRYYNVRTFITGKSRRYLFKTINNITFSGTDASFLSRLNYGNLVINTTEKTHYHTY